MMERRAQAALEFIMTYGWAILVVLVAIGALAYFGVLSPDKFLPAKCTLQAGIACLDHRATAVALTVNIQNSLGYDINLTEIAADQCVRDIVPSPSSVSNGGQASYTLVCTNSGSKYNGNVNLSFTNMLTGIAHKNQGQITTRIE